MTQLFIFFHKTGHFAAFFDGVQAGAFYVCVSVFGSLFGSAARFRVRLLKKGFPLADVKNKGRGFLGLHDVCQAFFSRSAQLSSVLLDVPFSLALHVMGLYGNDFLKKTRRQKNLFCM
jgi:hypothetical protein